ncbi:hypothetical protein D8674_025616 [Pyrus ussuriensis x Pyrus communis]|uniref:Uncharacterized protein n=1 Tax=Pyrus ussuriensis x Pyrus communis TaxID=2448454 RepID=A0A5N5I9D8_9ROSA|nr:hypothetical protein D8674_025616 [Pyrus ussuriensis x Pyrus communis]
MGRVTSKSNRAAFLNSSAKVSKVGAMAEREVERDTNWGFVSFGRFDGILGMEICNGILVLGLGKKGR